MNLDHENYLIVDLEATCCDRGTIQRHEMETIEIGAVMVDAVTLQPVSEFQTFIKPVRFPVLTEFCMNLTSITQDDVENAPNYTEAVACFSKWFSGYDDIAFCSWGDFDKKQIAQDSRHHGVGFSIGEPHINIKTRFSEMQCLKKSCSMPAALKLAGFELVGTYHRGIDDARNMVDLLPFIFSQKKLGLTFR